jgi:DnaD/phage-associated family protein
MSGLIMGLVFEMPIDDSFGRPEKFILLAYADHADQNGKSIYPSVDLIATKTGYKERAIQQITRNLELLGFLLPDGQGPYGTNRWYIPLERTKEGGVKIAPLPMLKNAPEGNAPEGNAPKPSVVVKELVVVINADIAKISQAYENEFGGLTPMIADAICEAVDTYHPDWILEAMQIAVANNKRNWKYVEGILKNCKEKNIRPSLNRLEKPNGKYNSSNRQGAKQSRSTSANHSEYSDADRAAAERVRQRNANRKPVSVP